MRTPNQHLSEMIHPPVCANSVAEIKLHKEETFNEENGRGLTLATEGMPVKAADGAAASRAAQASFLRNIVEFSLEIWRPMTNERR